MSYYKDQAIKREEAQLPMTQVEELEVEEIELGACSWERSPGYRDLMTAYDRIDHQPWPRAARVFWACYLGLILAGCAALGLHCFGA